MMINLIIEAVLHTIHQDAGLTGDPTAHGVHGERTGSTDNDIVNI